MSSLPPSLDQDANGLLRHLLSHYNVAYGLGHMSPSIYDTAWVSMISRNGTWLFPAAFKYVLDHQAPSGGWESYPSSRIDCILNTLASLLTLKLHSADTDVHDAIVRAEAFLSSQLQSWDVSFTERVGFEITVPVLLRALSKRGVEFSFPQHSLLMRLNDVKLSKIEPQTIYELGTPLLHSLEGLVGHIDFDKVAHHKRNGSFMASPSSTAAYLIHASMWDDECEAYLREVLMQCESHGVGSAPCAWPTTFFEISWVVCALHDSGYNFDHFQTETVAQVIAILKQGLDEGNGIVGFASNVTPDADDSAKVVTALRHLGLPVPIEPLCSAFELESHFKCYPFERNPSITVQCNVLSALLQAFEFPAAVDERTSPQLCESILKAVTFISETFWTANEEMEDKWHTSGLYSLLLITQSLTKFMLLFDNGHFTNFPENLVQTKVPIALFQILIRVLQAQNDDGSWGSCEETAYAILTLSSLSSLPFITIMVPTIQAFLDLGRRFLLTNKCEALYTKNTACLWIDKVSYYIPPVSHAYILAALHAASAALPGYPPTTTGAIDRLVLIPAQKVHNFLRFYRKMPLYRDCKDWQLLAYIAEGYLYLPMLLDVSKAVFGREGMGKPPYMESIPFTWTSGNSMTKTYSSPQNCFVCMTISLINYQVDEFFDSMVRDEGPVALPTLRKVLDDIFDALNEQKDIRNMEFGDTAFPIFVQYLHKYICFIVYYPSAQRASLYDKAHGRRELKAYLLAMMQQTEDSTHFARQMSWNTYLDPKSSYLKWMRTLSAEHVSGMTSCCLLVCHLSPDSDAFPAPELKFIAQDCMNHIGVLCRLWNDWGSMKRDIAERNINGTNFPEFAGMNEQQIKEAMRRISDYERSLMHDSLRELRVRAREVMGERRGNARVDGFELFFRGAESYNAIYEFKDLSAWKLSLTT